MELRHAWYCLFFCTTLCKLQRMFNMSATKNHDMIKVAEMTFLSVLMFDANINRSS